MKDQYPVRTLCLSLEVSTSGYYYWVKRQDHPCPRAQEAAILSALIQAIHVKNRHTYGSPRMHIDLRTQGHTVGRHRVARHMKELGLEGRHLRLHRKLLQPAAPP